MFLEENISLLKYIDQAERIGRIGPVQDLLLNGKHFTRDLFNEMQIPISVFRVLSARSLYFLGLNYVYVNP